MPVKQFMNAEIHDRMAAVLFVSMISLSIQNIAAVQLFLDFLMFGILPVLTVASLVLCAGGPSLPARPGPSGPSPAPPSRGRRGGTAQRNRSTT